ncbi:hypothetical protein ABG768_026404, partial [Culter alburnus]
QGDGWLTQAAVAVLPIFPLKQSGADRGHLRRRLTLHHSAERKRQGLSGVPYYCRELRTPILLP